MFQKLVALHNFCEVMKKNQWIEINKLIWNKNMYSYMFLLKKCFRNMLLTQFLWIYIEEKQLDLFN